MENERNSKVINDICEYSEEYQIKQMLQEYLKRIIVEKPANPVEFLIETIRSKPFVSKVEE